MRKILFSIILSTIICSTFAQQQNEPQKQIYKSESNKLYIQKTLPVYLWLSTSPDSLGDKVLLTSYTTPEFANPMYFDADGFNSIRIKGQVNNKTKEIVSTEDEVVFEVYGDSKAPESYVIVHTNSIKYEDGKRVYKNKCSLDLLSYDMFSDVREIYYSINGSAYQKITEQLNIDSEGDVVLKYYAVDNVGNREDVKELSFKIVK